MNTIHVLRPCVLRYILVLNFHPHLFIRLKYLWNFQRGNLQKMETAVCCKKCTYALSMRFAVSKKNTTYQRYFYITFRRVGIILLLAVCSRIRYCFWFHGKLMCLVLPCSLVFLRFHAAHENKKSKSWIFFCHTLILINKKRKALSFAVRGLWKK